MASRTRNGERRLGARDTCASIPPRSPADAHLASRPLGIGFGASGSRIDRNENTPDGEIARVHQEDLCQALGERPERKYQNAGGPAPPQIASLLRAFSAQPDEDVERFRDALIYNWLIAGTDAHAKNYSLMLAGGQVRLARRSTRTFATGRAVVGHASRRVTASGPAHRSDPLRAHW